ncbi:MAG: hypothetical protein HYY45_22150 [Deltaproteobacteria bacterium]|nr:hypothetical protein [Elusimicrobiota bacterium]MBI2989471.1 hypothetical protein [Deltaproteobacteria bacterium]MBI4217710.1 hypothetical protein [Elusimicrobiota bacterium]
MTDKEKIERLKPLDVAKYQNVDLNHLVMYAVGQLETIAADLSFENVVAASFKLFPKKFSLLGFPLYPDAKRVHDCLFRCTFKANQWLGGKTRQGFVITDRSRTFIKEAEDLLYGLKSKKTRVTSKTRRKEFLLEEVVSSSAYLKYTRGHGDSISDGDFCFLLQGTLDSSRETLSKNLAVLKRFAGELQQVDILKFLNWLEDHFKNFLSGKGT